MIILIGIIMLLIGYVLELEEQHERERQKWASLE